MEHHDNTKDNKSEKSKEKGKGSKSKPKKKTQKQSKKNSNLLGKSYTTQDAQDINSSMLKKLNRQLNLPNLSDIYLANKSSVNDSPTKLRKGNLSNSNMNNTTNTNKNTTNTASPYQKSKAIISKFPSKFKLKKKFNSSSSLYIQSTINSPEPKQLIESISFILLSQILEDEQSGKTISSKSDLYYFSEDKYITDYPLNFEDSRKDTAIQLPTQEEISEFLKALFYCAQFSIECCVLALIYINRIIALTGIAINSKNWRPLMFISLMIAQKVWDDKYLNNEDFAYIYPFFDTEQINILEIKFLEMVQYNVFVKFSLYFKYYLELKSLFSSSIAGSSVNNILNESECNSVSVNNMTNLSNINNINNISNLNNFVSNTSIVKNKKDSSQNTYSNYNNNKNSSSYLNIKGILNNNRITKACSVNNIRKYEEDEELCFYSKNIKSKNKRNLSNKSNTLNTGDIIKTKKSGNKKNPKIQKKEFNRKVISKTSLKRINDGCESKPEKVEKIQRVDSIKKKNTILNNLYCNNEYEANSNEVYSSLMNYNYEEYYKYTTGKYRSKTGKKSYISGDNSFFIIN